MGPGRDRRGSGAWRNYGENWTHRQALINRSYVRTQVRVFVPALCAVNNASFPIPDHLQVEVCQVWYYSTKHTISPPSYFIFRLLNNKHASFLRIDETALLVVYLLRAGHLRPIHFPWWLPNQVELPGTLPVTRGYIELLLWDLSVLSVPASGKLYIVRWLVMSLFHILAGTLTRTYHTYLLACLKQLWSVCFRNIRRWYRIVFKRGLTVLAEQALERSRVCNVTPFNPTREKVGKLLLLLLTP